MKILAASALAVSVFWLSCCTAETTTTLTKNSTTTEATTASENHTAAATTSTTTTKSTNTLLSGEKDETDAVKRECLHNETVLSAGHEKTDEDAEKRLKKHAPTTLCVTFKGSAQPYPQMAGSNEYASYETPNPAFAYGPQPASSEYSGEVGGYGQGQQPNYAYPQPPSSVENPYAYNYAAPTSAYEHSAPTSYVDSYDEPSYPVQPPPYVPPAVRFDVSVEYVTPPQHGPYSPTPTGCTSCNKHNYDVSPYGQNENQPYPSSAEYAQTYYPPPEQPAADDYAPFSYETPAPYSPSSAYSSASSYSPEPPYENPVPYYAPSSTYEEPDSPYYSPTSYEETYSAPSYSHSPSLYEKPVEPSYSAPTYPYTAQYAPSPYEENYSPPTYPYTADYSPTSYEAPYSPPTYPYTAHYSPSSAPTHYGQPDFYGPPANPYSSYGNSPVDDYGTPQQPRGENYYGPPPRPSLQKDENLLPLVTDIKPGSISAKRVLYQPPPPPVYSAYSSGENYYEPPRKYSPPRKDDNLLPLVTDLKPGSISAKKVPYQPPPPVYSEYSSGENYYEPPLPRYSPSRAPPQQDYNLLPLVTDLESGSISAKMVPYKPPPPPVYSEYLSGENYYEPPPKYSPPRKDENLLPLVTDLRPGSISAKKVPYQPPPPPVYSEYSSGENYYEQPSKYSPPRPSPQKDYNLLPLVTDLESGSISTKWVAPPPVYLPPSPSAPSYAHSGEQSHSEPRPNPEYSNSAENTYAGPAYKQPASASNYGLPSTDSYSFEAEDDQSYNAPAAPTPVSYDNLVPDYPPSNTAPEYSYPPPVYPPPLPYSLAPTAYYWPLPAYYSPVHSYAYPAPVYPHPTSYYGAPSEHQQYYAPPPPKCPYSHPPPPQFQYAPYPVGPSSYAEAQQYSPLPQLPYPVRPTSYTETQQYSPPQQYAPPQLPYPVRPSSLYATEAQKYSPQPQIPYPVRPSSYAETRPYSPPTPQYAPPQLPYPVRPSSYAETPQYSKPPQYAPYPVGPSSYTETQQYHNRPSSHFNSPYPAQQTDQYPPKTPKVYPPLFSKPGYTPNSNKKPSFYVPAPTKPTTPLPKRTTTPKSPVHFATTEKPSSMEDYRRAKEPAVAPAFGDPRNAAQNTKPSMVVTPTRLKNNDDNSQMKTTTQVMHTTTPATTTMMTTTTPAAATTQSPSSHQVSKTTDSGSTTMTPLTPQQLHQLNAEEKKKKTIARMAQLMQQSPYYAPPVV